MKSFNGPGPKKVKRNATHFNRICEMLQNVVCLIAFCSCCSRAALNSIMQSNPKSFADVACSYLPKIFFFCYYCCFCFGEKIPVCRFLALTIHVCRFNFVVECSREKKKTARAIEANEINEQFPFARKNFFLIYLNRQLSLLIRDSLKGQQGIFDVFSVVFLSFCCCLQNYHEIRLIDSVSDWTVQLSAVAAGSC